MRARHIRPTSTEVQKYQNKKSCPHYLNKGNFNKTNLEMYRVGVSGRGLRLGPGPGPGLELELAVNSEQLGT